MKILKNMMMLTQDKSFLLELDSDKWFPEFSLDIHSSEIATNDKPTLTTWGLNLIIYNIYI